MQVHHVAGNLWRARHPNGNGWLVYRFSEHPLNGTLVGFYRSKAGRLTLYRDGSSEDAWTVASEAAATGLLGALGRIETCPDIGEFRIRYRYCFGHSLEQWVADCQFYTLIQPLWQNCPPQASLGPSLVDLSDFPLPGVPDTWL